LIQRLGPLLIITNILKLRFDMEPKYNYTISWTQEYPNYNISFTREVLAELYECAIDFEIDTYGMTEAQTELDRIMKL
jgi:hypothetical protein